MSIDQKAHSWYCPKGCTGAADPRHPKVPQTSVWCLEKGTREPCRKTDCTKHNGERTYRAGSPWPHWHIPAGITQYQGNICVSLHYKLVNWIPPEGCEYTAGVAVPYSVDKKTKKICRVPLTSEGVNSNALPTGKWDLVASMNSAGPLAAELEVGFSKSNSKQTTKEERNRFFTSVSASAGVSGIGYSASVSGTVEQEKNTRIAETVASASTQETTRTLRVSCPAWGWGWMAYLFQWEVSDSQNSLKSEHFRCHYSQDGTVPKPVCMPTDCGDPSKNKYCQGPCKASR